MDRISNGQHIYKEVFNTVPKKWNHNEVLFKKPPNAGKNEKKLEFSYITSGRVNWCNHYRKVMTAFTNKKIHIFHIPIISH